MIRIRLGLRGSTRSTVLCSMLRSPVMEMSCLGSAARDKGQKRVPEPPARMTMYTNSSLLVLDTVDKVGDLPPQAADPFGGVKDVPQGLPEIGHLLAGNAVQQGPLQGDPETP